MLNLQKHLTPIRYLPVILGRQYAHRIHKHYHYSDEVRKTLVEKHCSWVVERIFTLQQNEREAFKKGIQNWEVKIMGDRSVMLCCYNGEGRVVYFEHGFFDEVPACDLSFVLYKNVLHTKQKKHYS